MRPRLVLFLKDPRPGRVKTRLAREIGTVEAAWWMRHQVRRLIRVLARDPRWEMVLAVTPDHAGLLSRQFPGHLPRLPQGAGDLGQRMTRVFKDVPPGPVVLVGGDIPGVTPGHIARAFHRLGRADAVVGPAPDGGYWLIGFKRARALPSGLFRNVRWSGPQALADTQATMAPLRIAVTDTLRDVDTAADLRSVLHR